MEIKYWGKSDWGKCGWGKSFLGSHLGEENEEKVRGEVRLGEV